MTKEETYFLEINNCLIEKNCDDYLRHMILTTFQSVKQYYEWYKTYIDGMDDYDEFLHKYVNAIKRTSKIVAVKDINDDAFLLHAVKPDNKHNFDIGYIKNEDGKYVITSDNPKYFPSLFAYSNASTKEVYFLTDKIIKKTPIYIKESVVHEFTHIRQLGFDIPMFVINRNSLFKCLREGNAMEESRFVNHYIKNYYEIPFKFNNDKQCFESYVSNNYAVYSYLYFKFQTLLGYQFMNEWACTENSESFFKEACRRINLKYGKEAFKKFYTNICLILNSIHPIEKNELSYSLDDYKELITLLNENNPSKISELQKHYNHLNNILNNKELFEKEYKIVNQASLINQKYSSMTTIILSEEDYFKRLENELQYLKLKIEVLSNYDYSKQIIDSNVFICEQILNNPKYLTDAIVDLETLISNCLIKDIKKEKGDNIDNYKKYIHYAINVDNNKLKNKVMSKPNETLNTIKILVKLKAIRSGILKEEKEIAK